MYEIGQRRKAKEEKARVSLQHLSKPNSEVTYKETEPKRKTEETKTKSKERVELESSTPNETIESNDQRKKTRVCERREVSREEREREEDQ